MSGLVLKLAPRERVLINGAVIENGLRRGRLNIITPGARILRLRDAIHPETATTPVRRTCYHAQLILSGESEGGGELAELQQAIHALQHVFADDKRAAAALGEAIEALRKGRYYHVLKHLRLLLPVEEALINRRNV